MQDSLFKAMDIPKKRLDQAHQAHRQRIWRPVLRAKQFAQHNAYEGNHWADAETSTDQMIECRSTHISGAKDCTAAPRSAGTAAPNRVDRFCAVSRSNEIQLCISFRIKHNIVASCSFLLLVVMHFATSSFLFLVVRPGATSSVLAPSSDALFY